MGFDSFELFSVFVLCHNDSAATMISHHHVDCASQRNNCFPFSITYDKTQHATHFDGQLCYYVQGRQCTVSKIMCLCSHVIG